MDPQVQNLYKKVQKFWEETDGAAGLNTICFCRGRRGAEFSLMNPMGYLPQTDIICSLYLGTTG